METQQQVIAFCKYGVTAQQGLANVAASINAFMEAASMPLRVQAMSHTVTQLVDPVPSVLDAGDPEYFVVTALVTFATG